MEHLYLEKTVVLDEKILLKILTTPPPLYFKAEFDIPVWLLCSEFLELSK